MSEAPSTGDAIRFRATLQLGGKTATGIEVPPEVVSALGPSKRPKVHAAVEEPVREAFPELLSGGLG